MGRRRRRGDRALTRYEEATRAFLQAVKLKPEELGGYRLLAQTFDRSEEAFDDAAGAFRELLAREAANPWARYFEALATFQQASGREMRVGWRPAPKRCWR